jgi:dihydrofolate reductase
MSKLITGITVSLDGFVSGRNPSREVPLGEGGERLHEWLFKLKIWRETHGEEGGETGPDDDVMREALERSGAMIMGRKMFNSGDGPWEADPMPTGWWGDTPPFKVPVFVLTHHEREPATIGQTTFTFVTDGIEAALEQARAAAGEKDVTIGGGASVIQQYLDAGVLDELDLTIAPLLLGGGTRLFADGPPKELELDSVVATTVTHVRYRVVKS